MTTKLFLAFLALFDIAGVALGYEGISRLRQFQFPPFFPGLGVFIVPLPVPPNWLVLFWDSICGHIILWSGCLLVPIVAIRVTYGNQRYWSGFAIMSVWTLGSGVIGVWFWFHAIFNASDAR